jgi:hypothetical protein
VQKQHLEIMTVRIRLNRAEFLGLLVLIYLVQENKILKFLGFMWNPLSWVMELAALMAIVLANGQGKPPDWEDFLGILVLLLVNSTISFIEENNAGNAAAALMAHLAPKTKVCLQRLFDLCQSCCQGIVK